ncbi:MAG: sensor histidine kinase [Gammaproteobacteria bacterium]|nr:sensor histidine kinase [Gammaproteobacteria bacterium]
MLAHIRVLTVENQQAAIEVSDFGEGIPDEMSARIFEPFYTGSAKGIGLGLFIARELCECNLATLTYTHGTETKSCFRITFADPKRWLI